MTALLITDVRPWGGAAADVLVEDGRIAAVAPGLAPPPGAPVEAGHGALLLPGLVEGHCHLDKSVWGLGWYVNTVGPRLIDKIDNERAERRRLKLDPERQCREMTRRFLANGTTRFRTHVDVDTEIGVSGIEGVMAARAALAPLVEMQVVAFPQSGMLVRPGTVELLDRALAMGAEVVGGLDPSAIDRDPKGHLDAVFALSQKHGRPIDIHLHEPGDLGAFAIELMLERVRALGMQGRLVVSHAFCLGDLPDRQSEAMMAEMAKEGIAIATTATPARVVPSLVKARAAGIPVFAGNDGIRDTWGPYGVPDMLQRAMIVGMRNNLRRDDEVMLALEAVSTEGARGCGFADYGLAPGDRADLVLVRAETVAEAVVAQPPRRLVVAAGRVVARDGILLV